MRFLEQHDKRFICIEAIFYNYDEKIMDKLLLSVDIITIFLMYLRWAFEKVSPAAVSSNLKIRVALYTIYF